jgi:hypothetical protein
MLDAWQIIVAPLGLLLVGFETVALEEVLRNFERLRMENPKIFHAASLA